MSVTVAENTTGNTTRYTYSVVNRTSKPIVALRIGYDAATDQPQLTTLPPGWTFTRGLPPETAVAPAGWSVRLVTTEENPKFMLEWTSERGAASGIRPGKAESAFRITLPHPAAEYRRARFEVTLGDTTRLHGDILPSSVR